MRTLFSVVFDFVTSLCHPYPKELNHQHMGNFQLHSSNEYG